MDWPEVYDFLEYVLSTSTDADLAEAVNRVLAKELSAYRWVGHTFTKITDEQEIAAIEEALADDDFPGVKLHLSAALRMLSDRNAPDYRNSIKESISAVESAAQKITGQSSPDLAQALAVLEQRHGLHGALKEGFKKLYGYTSDERGIRHAMVDAPKLEATDAKFFLLSCTTFINYLKSKV